MHIHHDYMTCVHGGPAVSNKTWMMMMLRAAVLADVGCMQPVGCTLCTAALGNLLGIVAARFLACWMLFMMPNQQLVAVAAAVAAVCLLVVAVVVVVVVVDLYSALCNACNALCVPLCREQVSL